MFAPLALNESVYGEPLVFWIVKVSLTESPGEAFAIESVQPERLLSTERPGVPQPPAAQVPPVQPLPPPPPPPPPPPVERGERGTYAKEPRERSKPRGGPTLEG